MTSTTLPANVVYVTVTGSEFGGNGVASGVVEFIPERILLPALKLIGIKDRYIAPLVGGAFSIDLPVDPAGSTI